MNKFRVGFGYDVHPLVPGRKLIIGGVSINYLKELWVILMLMFYYMRYLMLCSVQPVLMTLEPTSPIQILNLKILTVS